MADVCANSDAAQSLLLEFLRCIEARCSAPGFAFELFRLFVATFQKFVFDDSSHFANALIFHAAPMSDAPFIDPAIFADFDNVQIQIVRDGEATDNGRGAIAPGPPIEVLPLQGAQEWELSASDKTGLTGEQIALTKKIRLGGYYPELTAKMTAIVDGAIHNIIVPGHDGSKSCSILTVRKITG